MIEVFQLLGGISESGWDAYFLGINTGFLALGDRIKALPDVTLHTYTWGNYPKASQDMKKAIKLGHKVAGVGYSGGGSRLTWIAADTTIKIDLLIAYDPSPSWQMIKLGPNVAKAICYHNTAPFMLGLGGGVMVGKQVETINIAEQHLAVQYDQSLHTRTLAEIQRLQ